MRHLVDGYRGIRLILALNGDRVLTAATLALALACAGWAALRIAGF